MPPLDLLLLDIVVILLAARLLGEAARRLGQPRVIGEIVAGIVLGPTLLGRLGGDWLFPPSVIPALGTLATVGLVLFMFVVGLEVDRQLLNRRPRAVTVVSLLSTTVPFALGSGLAALLAHRYAPGATLPFVLFFAISVSATAFPVLARILTDRGLDRSLLGGLAIASAAVIDVFAYAVLAVVSGIASASEQNSWRLLLAPIYVAVMFFAVRPLLKRLSPGFERPGGPGPGNLAVLLIGLFASAWATQWMNVHFIFGAFLFGAIMPRSDVLLRRLRDGLEPAVQLMLPVFFIVTGLTVDLGHLEIGAEGVLAAILAVAVAGKVGGGYLGARLAGLRPRSSMVMGVLVNTRGLTELVILAVGLQQHLIGPGLYALLVVMALVTTAMTGPLLNWLNPRTRTLPDLEPIRRSAADPASATVAG